MPSQANEVQRYRWVYTEDLVGAADIARRLHYSTSIIYGLIAYSEKPQRHPFPRPVAVVGRTKVWNWPDVVAWANQTLAGGRKIR